MVVVFERTDRREWWRPLRISRDRGAALRAGYNLNGGGVPVPGTPAHSVGRDSNEAYCPCPWLSMRSGSAVRSKSVVLSGPPQMGSHLESTAPSAGRCLLLQGCRV